MVLENIYSRGVTYYDCNIFMEQATEGTIAKKVNPRRLINDILFLPYSMHEMTLIFSFCEN
jgi:hypothetical protein